MTESLGARSARAPASYQVSDFQPPKVSDVQPPATATSAYGEDAAQAHELVVLCLTSATHPVLLTDDGELVRVPKRRVRAVITRAGDWAKR